MMDRRSFLRLLGGAATVTAAGLVLPYEPQRVYSFLWNNPLSFEESMRRQGWSLIGPGHWFKAQWVEPRVVITHPDFGKHVQMLTMAQSHPMV